MTERLTNAAEVRKPSDHNRRWQFAANLIISRLMVATTIAMPFHLWNVRNINENMEIAENAQININVRGEALNPENSDKAIVFIDGFGAYDANNIVKVFGEPIQKYLQDGQLWSVSYGNAPLSVAEIASQIIDLTDEHDITEIQLVGYSAGGDVALAVNDEIRATTALEVPLIVAISTPDGSENLRKEIQDLVQFYLQLLGQAPILAYYDPARFIGEAMLRQPLYTNSEGTINLEAFNKTMWRIVEDLSDKKYPSTKLLYDQMQAIENFNLEHLMNEITDKYADNLLNPTMVYIGTGKGGYDYLVDDKQSGENFCRYAADADLSCVLAFSPNAVHTKPEMSAKDYEQTFASIGQQVKQNMIHERDRFNFLNRPVTYPKLINTPV